MSAARPKIADYPFTTLVPNLGVIRSGDTVYTMADVPGLIPGASTGKGLGVQFLRHVERCAVLVHVVDMATMEPGRDPESDIEALEHELAEYGGEELDLVGRLRIAVLNKIDVPDARELVDLVRASLEKRGLDVYPVSAATGEGLTEFGYALAARRRGAPREPAADGAGPGHDRAQGRRRLRVHRRARPGGSGRASSCAASGPSAGSGRPTSPTTRPSASSPTGSTGSASRSSWPRPAPSRATRSPIGGVTFDWVPTLPAGTLTVEESAGLGGRGTDSRIDAPHRVRAEERLAAKKARRVPYELSDETWTDSDLPTDAAGRRRDAARPEIAGARRVVVKVGSSSLTTLPGGLDAARLSRAGRRAGRACAPPAARSCSSPRAPSPRASRRWA